MTSPLQTVAQETAEFMEKRINAALGTKVSPAQAEITVLADLIAIVAFGILKDPSAQDQRMALYQNLCNRADAVAKQMVQRVMEMSEGEARH